MSLTLDLPAELADALAAEAARLGLSLPDYAVRLLAAARPLSEDVHSGAELVAYWQAAGVVGSRPDLTDSPAHARSLRQRAARRQQA
ncbi:MAG: hypothetical protein ACREJB_15750 [Planctomycetaceae bacterium]